MERRTGEQHGAVADDERWGHSIEYHRLLIERIPTGARHALDVGCGDGLLARQLAPHVDTVVGLDRDEPSVRWACDDTTERNVHFVRGDLRQMPFAPASFDVVVSVMAIHHVDLTDGLKRLAELLRPGGLLGIIGTGRSHRPIDVGYDALGFVAHHIHPRRPATSVQRSPMGWPPPNTYGQVRRTASVLLPGCEYRRQRLFRYTLTWIKPEEGARTGQGSVA